MTPRADGIPVYCAHTEIVPIEKCVPNPRNPNQHPPKQIKLLAQIIKGQGWRAPITVSTRSGFVVRGHGRLMAAQELGVCEVPVDYQDYASEAEEWADLIADNRIAELAEMDHTALVDLLQELDTGDFDIELTGFTEAEIEDLMSYFQKKADPDEFDVDTAAEAIVEPVTKRGMIYALGRHRLMCGDATSFEDVKRLMDGKLADMVFTDPPYNVNYGEKASMLNDYQKGHRITSSIKNDHMASEAFLEFLTDVFKNVYIALNPGGAFYICHAESSGLEFRKAVLDAGFLLKQCIIWVKNSMVLGRQDYQWKHEPILYGWKQGAPHKWYGGRKKTTVLKDRDGLVVREEENGVLLTFTVGTETITLKVPSYEIIYDGDDSGTTVWYFDKPLRNAEHPTMKPVALIERAIKNSSKRGQIVLDLFGGSGSTLIAAEKTGRTCYMMELDEKYCDVIVRRWEELTGQKVVVVHDPAA